MNTNTDNEVLLSSKNDRMSYDGNSLISYEKNFNVFDNEKQKVAEYYLNLREIEFSIVYNNEVINGTHKSQKYSTSIVLFKDDMQISEIIKSRVIHNGLDEYFIFLLDEYNYLVKKISLFTLYYDFCYYNLER